MIWLSYKCRWNSYLFMTLYFKNMQTSLSGLSVYICEISAWGPCWLSPADWGYLCPFRVFCSTKKSLKRSLLTSIKYHVLTVLQRLQAKEDLPCGDMRFSFFFFLTIHTRLSKLHAINISLEVVMVI